MKIAFICGFAWEPKGTARARAFPLAVELVKHGHEVTIFLTPYDNLEHSGKEWTLEGVRIQNLRVPNIKIRSLAALVPQLLTAVRTYAPDLVHVFKPKGLAGAAAMFLRSHQGKLVLDCDDWEGWGGWNEIKNYSWIVKEYIDLQEKWLIRRTPVITVASRELADRTRKLRGSDSAVFYVPNCLSRERVERDAETAKSSAAEEKKALGLPATPLIFYAGHFDPADDVDFLCRAVGPVLERTGAAIALVGEGPELGKVKNFFSTLAVNAHFFGRISFEHYARVLNASDIATFPFPDNAVYRAKCSVRILDYMSFGKAILTTSIGQNLEYVVHGESGLLVPPADEKVYQEALDLLLSHPDLRNRLGRNARRGVLANFLWNGNALETCLAAYQAAVGSSVAFAAG